MAVIKIALVLLVAAGASGQERETAIRSLTGALLCPLVEDYYSYRRTGNYGPARWGEISECCEGRKQSPVNLQSGSQSLCGQWAPPSISYNITGMIPGNLYNNGHDPTVSFRGFDTAHLYDAPFAPGAYILDNMHFHFCMQTGKGSEHAIDGRFYPGEIHLVHYKAIYGSLARAVLYEDGVVVVGIMLQPSSSVGGSLNQEAVKIIQSMSYLRGVGKEHRLPVQVNVEGILPTSRAFFTYHGSMTSPPCSESVRWVVFRDPIHISLNEVEILGRLPNEERGFIAQSCNDRPLQNGNTIVETNFACLSGSGGGEMGFESWS